MFGEEGAALVIFAALHYGVSNAMQPLEQMEQFTAVAKRGKKLLDRIERAILQEDEPRFQSTTAGGALIEVFGIWLHDVDLRT